ncbi:MAG: hypothetical protein ABR589_11080 [Chthoniobacterales bacterium]
MNIEVPSVARRLFVRLCRGENRLLSRNGPDDDADLFRQVESAEQENICRAYFAVLGFRLERGDGCYYFTAEDEPLANIEAKLERMVRLIRLLDFLSTNIENFGEGMIFSAANLGARCHGDPRAERFLEESAKGANYSERLEGLLELLVRQGYLSKTDPSRQEYRVLSAIHYLQEFADRIQIHQQPEIGGSSAES